MDRAALLKHVRTTHFAPADRERALADAQRIARYLHRSGADRVVGIGSAFDTQRAFTTRSDIDLAVRGLEPSTFYTVSARAANLTSFALDLIPLECATALLRRVVEARGVEL